MHRTEFERIVQEEFARLPPPILGRIKNVECVVRAGSGHEERTAEDAEDRDLLGLYVGVPLDQRGSGYGIALPDRIFLFQKPIEEEARDDPAGIRRVVRETLLHEIAHHFGFSEDEVESWEQEQGWHDGEK